MVQSIKCVYMCDVERRESNDTVFCPFFLLSSAHSEAACSVRRFPLIMIRMLWGVYVSTSWLRDTPSNTAMYIRAVFWFNDKYSLSISFSYTWIWIFASHTKVIIYMIFFKILTRKTAHQHNHHWYSFFRLRGEWSHLVNWRPLLWSWGQDIVMLRFVVQPGCFTGQWREVGQEKRSCLLIPSCSLVYLHCCSVDGTCLLTLLPSIPSYPPTPHTHIPPSTKRHTNCRQDRKEFVTDVNSSRRWWWWINDDEEAERREDKNNVGDNSGCGVGKYLTWHMTIKFYFEGKWNVA